MRSEQRHAAALQQRVVELEAALDRRADVISLLADAAHLSETERAGLIVALSDLADRREAL